MNILVGPNNSGKSTILSAFRILEVGIHHAWYKKADIVKGPSGECFGYQILQESISLPLEYVHTNYEDIDSTITFRLSNNNKLILFFPKEGGCFLLTDTQGKPISTPSVFRKNFPIAIEIVPVLGPVEQNEKVLSEETIRRGLSTHRASRHFRNYWYYYPDGFDEFSEMVSKTWPGMTIQAPYLVDMMSQSLAMFCEENRFPRELFLSGFGFQIWCQLLTHVSRCNDATLLIVDEPEVYLHPDVQRQLLGILRYCGPDIIVATHSTEIMGEADASEILLIDKSKRSAERLRDIEGVQAALNAVGSVQNITLTQLARTRRLLFIEGPDDFKILRRFARQIGLTELATGMDLTAIESGGFSSWERIKSLAWGFQSALGSELHIGAIFDRDYWSDEEVDSILADLRNYLEIAHIHSRKEIENYLLVPDVLERAFSKALADRARRTEGTIEQTESIIEIIDRITIPFRNSSQAQYIAKRTKYLEHSSIDNATITAETIENFNTKWDNLNTRMEIVPGKEVLRQLRYEIQTKYSVNLTDFRIIDEFKLVEIPGDLLELLKQLEEYRKAG